MKSPFPGMDPYLEPYWRDVHQRLITYACDQLQPKLPIDLRARIEERLFVEGGEEGVRVVYPDVHIVERRQPSASRGAPPAGALAVEPLIIEVADEPVTQSFIHIVDVSRGYRVITSIEFRSPSNKLPGDGRDLYQKKREEMMASGVSLVEIDLTRAGERDLIIAPWRLPPSHRTLYLAVVWRSWKLRQREVYALPLEQPLPALRIPLREKDEDVLLELQPLIELCYQNGRYDDLDYKSDPRPPLPAAEAAWTGELLRSGGWR